MNKHALNAFCGILLFLSGAYSLYSKERINYYGITELNSPYKYFIRIKDFENIYELEHNSPHTNLLSEEFMGMISDRKYKEAEKWLVDKYEHPYYLLNLVILYLYFNKEEFAGLFQQWQKSTSQSRMANFINLMAVRQLNHALHGLSAYWIDPTLKLYSNYMIYRKNNEIDLIIKNFRKWENLNSGNDFSKKLYNRTKAEWESDRKFLVPDSDEKRNITKTPALDIDKELEESEAKDIENKLVEGKYSGEILKEILGNYLKYLQHRKQWEKMKILVNQISWISREDKLRLLKQFTEWENTLAKPVLEDNTIQLEISH